MAIDNYKEKLEFLCIKQNWTCPICKQKMNYGQNLNFHHAGIENTKHARKTYPLFLDSVLNGIILHQDCHVNHGTGYGKMKESDVIQVETFLKYIEKNIKNDNISNRVVKRKKILTCSIYEMTEYENLRKKIIMYDDDSLKFTVKQIWERLGK